MLEINKLQKKYENFELNCSMKVEKGYITALVGEKGKNTQEKDISIHCHKDAVHGKADYI